MIRSDSFWFRIDPAPNIGLCLLLVVVALGGCAKPDRTSGRSAVQDRRAEASRVPTADDDALSEPLKVEPRPESSAPDTAQRPPAHARANTELQSAENQSLAFARAVLESEGSRKLDAWERERIAQVLVSAEIQHDLPVALSLAIIKQESRFDPAARGPAGSIGLMQLQPATARQTAERTGMPWTNQKLLRDPEVNVRLGLAYLVELRNRFQNTEHAVGAYNIGPTKMRRLLNRRPFRRGPYLTKVYGHAEALENEYSN